MALSAPSSPKRFVPTYLVARNFSNDSAAFKRSTIRRLRSLDSSYLAPSSLAWIHRCSVKSWMCMYSTPMVRQYASRSTPSRSPSGSFSVPPTPPVRNSRSRSQMVRP